MWQVYELIPCSRLGASSSVSDRNTRPRDGSRSSETRNIVIIDRDLSSGEKFRALEESKELICTSNVSMPLNVSM